MNEEYGVRFRIDNVYNLLNKIKIPLRMELVSADPYIVLDAAHNVAGIEALIAGLEDLEYSVIFLR